MLSDLIYRVQALFRRAAWENELDAEVKFHFDQQVEKNMHAGMTREEALRHFALNTIGFVMQACVKRPAESSATRTLSGHFARSTRSSAARWLYSQN
jgi:hypothetical protein